MGSEKDPVILEELKIKDTYIKMNINPLYGVFCSPYFKFNNVILSHNITALARGYAFLGSAAFNGILTITDGFCCQPASVVKIKNPKDRKPGLASLSCVQKLESHKNVEITNLGCLDWTSVFNEEKFNEVEFKKINLLANTHFEIFLNNYNLKSPYKMESKEEHITKLLGFSQKANYGGISFKTGLTFLKYRGEKDSSGTGCKILNAIVGAKEDIVIENNITREKRLVTGKHFVNNKRFVNLNLDGVYSFEHIPGFETIVEKDFKLQINELIPETYKEYKKILKGREKVADFLTNFMVGHTLEEVMQEKIKKTEEFFFKIRKINTYKKRKTTVTVPPKKDKFGGDCSSPNVNEYIG